MNIIRRTSALNAQSRHGPDSRWFSRVWSGSYCWFRSKMGHVYYSNHLTRIELGLSHNVQKDCL